MINVASTGTRVIEVASTLSAGVTGRFFADLGADVVRVEEFEELAVDPAERAAQTWARAHKRVPRRGRAGSSASVTSRRSSLAPTSSSPMSARVGGSRRSRLSRRWSTRTQVSSSLTSRGSARSARTSTTWRPIWSCWRCPATSTCADSTTVNRSDSASTWSTS